MKYIPNTVIAIHIIETLHTPCLGILDPSIQESTHKCTHRLGQRCKCRLRSAEAPWLRHDCRSHGAQSRMGVSKIRGPNVDPKSQEGPPNLCKQPYIDNTDRVNLADLAMLRRHHFVHRFERA